MPEAISLLVVKCFFHILQRAVLRTHEHLGIAVGELARIRDDVLQLVGRNRFLRAGIGVVRTRPGLDRDWRVTLRPLGRFLRIDGFRVVVFAVLAIRGQPVPAIRLRGGRLQAERRQAHAKNQQQAQAFLCQNLHHQHLRQSIRDGKPRLSAAAPRRRGFLKGRRWSCHSSSWARPVHGTQLRGSIRTCG